MFVFVPQWELLNRSDMISFETNYTLNLLTRLNTTLLRPIPIWEFSDIIACLENSGRSRVEMSNIIPSLNPFPRKFNHLPNDYKTTAPTTWLVQFNRLPAFIKCHLGTKKFGKMSRDFLYSLCQHNEFHEQLCSNCNLNCRYYQNKGFQNLNHNNLRSNNHTLDSNRHFISRQMIIESDFMTNYFYAAINNKTNWLNSTVPLSRIDFILIGPSPD